MELSMSRQVASPAESPMSGGMRGYSRMRSAKRSIIARTQPPCVSQLRLPLSCDPSGRSWMWQLSEPSVASLMESKSSASASVSADARRAALALGLPRIASALAALAALTPTLSADARRDATVVRPFCLRLCLLGLPLGAWESDSAPLSPSPESRPNGSPYASGIRLCLVHSLACQRLTLRACWPRRSTSPLRVALDRGILSWHLYCCPRRCSHFHRRWNCWSRAMRSASSTFSTDQSLA